MSLRFAVIDGCPAPRSVAPYIYLVTREAGQTASSIYRGEDARELLHRNGKRTQAEIHRDLPTISNPAGQSQHELRSDGRANPGPVGRTLKQWEVGIDSGGDDATSKERVEAAARHYGWQARHPYSRGVEGHHWCFAAQPKAKGARQRALVAATRVRLLWATRPPVALGSKGPRAQWLKRRLARLGYLKRYVRGPIRRDAADAIKRFQRDHKLAADGIAGPATQRAIDAADRHRKGKPARANDLSDQHRTYAQRATAAGAHFAETIVREADKEGVRLSLAFALFEQETGFRNVFGHDPTIFAGAGKVTRVKYLAYKLRRGPTGRGGMQGVGPGQLTWWATQDAADKEGGCWKPPINVRVALRTLAQNIRANGQHTGIARYNGAGAAAEAYARSVEAKQEKWHRTLTGGKP